MSLARNYPVVAAVGIMVKVIAGLGMSFVLARLYFPLTFSKTDSVAAQRFFHAISML